jgi:F0F1-type ATP synthase beta subunit
MTKLRDITVLVDSIYRYTLAGTEIVPRCWAVCHRLWSFPLAEDGPSARADHVRKVGSITFHPGRACQPMTTDPSPATTFARGLHCCLIRDIASLGIFLQWITGLDQPPTLTHVVGSHLQHPPARCKTPSARCKELRDIICDSGHGRAGMNKLARA